MSEESLREELGRLRGRIEEQSAQIGSLTQANTSCTRQWREMTTLIHGTPHAPGLLSEVVAMKRTLAWGVRILMGVGIAIASDVLLRLLEHTRGLAS